MKENSELALNKVIENSTVDVMKFTTNYDIVIRKGIVGDCKNHFNKEKSDLVNEKVINYFLEQVSKGYGLKI